MVSGIETLLLPALVSLIVAAITVFLTDYFGVRRDRERLRLELYWKYQETRMTALTNLLDNAPTFNLKMSQGGRLEGAALDSISNLIVWTDQKAMPWLSKKDAETVSVKRAIVEKWLNIVIAATAAVYQGKGSFEPYTVPSREINEFRVLVVEAIKCALDLAHDEARSVTRKSKW